MLPPPGYRDVTLIGTGATSRVYRAICGRTKQPVALKRLHKQLIQNQDALSRLRREFEALSKLNHPSIVRVRDVIRWQRDPTVVMDFIPGQDLKEKIQREGPLNPSMVEHIARALLDILVAAHGAGIVHRDLKPQNIRLGPGDQIFLLDFGSARLEASSQLTATGTSVGTPDYMAPELFAGSVYDPRADIYGLGATLFECLTGRAPQIADSLTELAYRRTQEDIQAVATLRPNAPPKLCQMIDRCLRRSPDARYPTANLALWAIDNPQLERSFQERQSDHPPCLQCGDAIPEASALCPSCGCDHPFYYKPGSTHLDLVSVKEPQAFMAEMIGRFPELSSHGNIKALTERLTALDASKQRLISFIDQKEAARLQEELNQHGVQTEVVDDPGTSRFRFHGFGLFFLLASALIVVAMGLGIEPSIGATLVFLVSTTAGALGISRALAVAKASQGVLTHSKYPAAIAPKTRSLVTASAMGLAGLGLSAPTLAGWLATLPFAAGLGKLVLELQIPLLFGAGALGIATIGAWLTRFSPASVGGISGPEPSAGKKLERAFSLPRSLAKRMNTQVAVMLTSAVIMLVPMELTALSVARDKLPTFWSLWVRASETAEPAAIQLSELVAVQDNLPTWSNGGAPDVELSQPSQNPSDLVDLKGPQGQHGQVRAPAKPGAFERFFSRLTPLQIGLSGGMLLLTIGLLLSLRRRRRKLRTGADELFAGLDFNPLYDAAEPPSSRRPRRQLALPDQVAQQETSDPFIKSARRRVTELAYCLSAEETHRLDRALKALDRAERDPLAERSLLARCILEADDEQRLRFEFLALEGRMEAVAAQRWAAQLSQGETQK